LETLSGLSTLRAFGWTNSLIELNYALLDTSQRPMYLLSMVQTWLITILAVVVAILAIFIVALATHLGANTGFIGASLVSLMAFGSFLAHIVQAWTTLELSIGAVARLESFCNTVKREHDDEEVEEPLDWPYCGAIEIDNVSASYK
jgi:ATP-binding cassette, subfamily C (CFTR/MRP), member 1